MVGRERYGGRKRNLRKKGKFARRKKFLGRYLKYVRESDKKMCDTWTGKSETGRQTNGRKLWTKAKFVLRKWGRYLKDVLELIKRDVWLLDR